MKIFLKGKPNGILFAKLKKVLYDLELQHETIRYYDIPGLFTPDLNRKETKALKYIIEYEVGEVEIFD